jgi:hypothetical protein
MSKIPESCSPVNARSQFESALLEAETVKSRTSCKKGGVSHAASLLPLSAESGSSTKRPSSRRRSRSC